MNGWVLAQYKLVPGKPNTRYCSIEDFASQIVADGGSYPYAEILGNYAIVKLAGISAATAQAIISDPVIRQFPGVQQLADSLAVLTDQQWASYRQFALDLGYPAAEWDAAFTGAGTQGNYTLRDVIAFVARRRITPRFDSQAQAIVLDGAVVSPAVDPTSVDARG